MTISIRKDIDNKFEEIKELVLDCMYSTRDYYDYYDSREKTAEMFLNELTQLRYLVDKQRQSLRLDLVDMVYREEDYKERIRDLVGYIVDITGSAPFDI